jgi:hypothetical protein
MSNVKKGRILDRSVAAQGRCGRCLSVEFLSMDLLLSGFIVFWIYFSVQANCGGVLRAPPLMYKKWGFTEQDRVTDSEVVGPSTDNTFDHLVTASLIGGFSATYRSSAPQTSLILAVGKKPYVGFHYALEGEVTPLLAGVTKAVVNKVKSTFGQVVP